MANRGRLQSIRKEIREIFAAPMTKGLDEEKRLRPRLKELMQRLPRHERTLWELWGEGAPEAYPDVCATVDTSRSLLERLDEVSRQSGLGAVSLWPELPPSSCTSSELRELHDIYDAPLETVDTLYQQWDRKECFNRIIHELSLGIDTYLGELIVPTGVNASHLIATLPKEIFSLRRQYPLMQVWEEYKACICSVARDTWIGLYTSGETNQLLLGGPVELEPFLKEVCNRERVYCLLRKHPVKVWISLLED